MNCGNIEQRARVDHVLGQGGLDRQLLEATIQLLPIGQQHGVKLGDLRKVLDTMGTFYVAFVHQPNIPATSLASTAGGRMPSADSPRNR